jgi:thioredoxin reductase (NADPH)
LAKTILMTVDDEPQVLNAVERDLRQHYRSEYRIIKAGSGAEALDTIHQLKRRNDMVALFLVDQKMPSMTGTEFLEEARKVYPEAKKVLLTAYADTEAAIASINSIGLDHYLMKPWDPPEQNLYPVLDDLLSDWLANAAIPYDGIRVAGTLWSASSHNVKDFLARNQVPYQWLDIEINAEALAMVEATQDETHQLPVIFFPDGSTLVNPDNRALAEKAGLTTEASHPFYDLIIIGGGPAGLAASVYGASEGLDTVMLEKSGIGGQAGMSARIENYLGFPKGLSGADLARRATTQAKRLGAELLSASEVVEIRFEDPYRFVKMADGEELTCHALMLATGVDVRELNVPGAENVTGAGLFYSAAVTEAANYKGKRVFVVGGANSAGQGAVFLSGYAKQVTMLVRGSSLEVSMSKYLVDQITSIENIDLMLRTEVLEIHGESSLESVLVVNKDTEETQELEGAAMFVFIGAVPRTDLVESLVERDNAGFIMTGPDLMQNGSRPKGWRLKRDPYLFETSVPGIFAVGDVRHGSVKRVAAAIGEGSACLQSIHRYLSTV